MVCGLLLFETHLFFQSIHNCPFFLEAWQVVANDNSITDGDIADSVTRAKSNVTHTSGGHGGTFLLQSIILLLMDDSCRSVMGSSKWTLVHWKEAKFLDRKLYSRVLLFPRNNQLVQWTLVSFWIREWRLDSWGRGGVEWSWRWRFCPSGFLFRGGQWITVFLGIFGYSLQRPFRLLAIIPEVLIEALGTENR